MATRSTMLHLDALLLAFFGGVAVIAAGVGGGCRAGSQNCRIEEKPAAAGSAAAMLQSRSDFHAIHQGDLAVQDSVREGFAAEGGESGQSDVDAEATIEAGAEAARAARAAIAVGQKATARQQLAVARTHMRNLAKMYTSHGALLRRTMAELPKTIFAENDAKTSPGSNNQLSTVMDNFINAQAASSDKCPALLLEAKHQWNVLHSHIIDLAQEINITEMSITTTTVQVDTTYEELYTSEEWEAKQIQKCKKTHEEDYRMYYILIAELHEMQLIAAGGASAQVAYNYSAWAAGHAQTDWSTSVTHTAEIVSTGGTTSSGGTTTSSSSSGNTIQSTSGSAPTWNAVSSASSSTGFAWAPPTDANGAITAGWTPPWQPSLVQESSQAEGTDSEKVAPSSLEPRAPPGAEGGPPAEAPRGKVEGARSLVQKTKELARQLSACMAAAQDEQPHAEAQAALLQEDAPAAASLDQSASSKAAGNTSPGTSGITSGSPFSTGTSGTWGSSSATSSSTTTGTGAWSTSGGSTITTGQVTTTTGGTFSTTSGGLSTGMIGSSTTTTGNMGSGYSTGAVSHSSSHASSHAYSHSASHSAIHTWSHSTSNHHSASHSYYSSNIINASQCDYQKQILQVTYIKAYVEITRLIAEYEVFIKGTACEDWVEQTEGQVEKEYKNKIEKYTVTVTSMTQKLETYKARITHAYTVEANLRAHILTLTARCNTMGATVSSLDKVRDAIAVIGLCPGLGAITFSLPEWVGTWTDGEFDSFTMSDAEIDDAMNLQCQTLTQSTTETIRAAETSEILLRSIKGMPTKNEAALPLMGPCPNCAGDIDEAGGPVHVSGHARICWDPQVTLAGLTRRTDCSSGKKALLCVRHVAMPGPWVNPGSLSTTAVPR